MTDLTLEFSALSHYGRKSCTSSTGRKKERERVSEREGNIGITRTTSFFLDHIYKVMSSPLKSPASVATQRILTLSNHFTNSSNDKQQQDKMATPSKFHGWMGLDKDSANGKMVWQEFEPKNWTEDDVDIKVTHCGICGTDIHTLRSGWVSTYSEGKEELQRDANE